MSSLDQNCDNRSDAVSDLDGASNWSDEEIDELLFNEKEVDARGEPIYGHSPDIRTYNGWSEDVETFIGTTHYGARGYDLAHRMVTRIPVSLMKSYNLIYLNLSDNALKEFPDYFLTHNSGLHSLRVLNLSMNELTHIPESINRLTHLKKFYLLDNQLTSLPSSMGDLSDLVVLDIRKNPHLKSVSPSIIARLTNLKRFRFDENLGAYDCDNSEVVQGRKDVMKIIDKYGSVMVLFLFVDNDDETLKQKYREAAKKNNSQLVDDNEQHYDSGFNLLVPEELMRAKKIDHRVKCMAYKVDNHGQFNTGYYLYPRSSISKTNYRMANSVGIIDSGYRGNLIAKLDMIDETSHNYNYLVEVAGNNHENPIEQYSSMFQICSPTLSPVYVVFQEMIEGLGEKTSRGEGGFGSTGK